MLALVFIVSVVAIWLTWFDVTLFREGNLALFDETLSAEGTAAFAVIALLGGLAAAYRELIGRFGESPKT